MTNITDTIRVTSDRGAFPFFPGVPHGTVYRGIDVPHEAANLQCFHPLGTGRDPETGIAYPILCRKRAGHPTPKDEAPHVAVDTRIVAAPTRVAHGQRFAPSGIPAGVDQTITFPHDCRNHLRDVQDIADGYR